VSAGDNLNKREYTDRAYAQTKGTDQNVYLYLIDRMWPFEDEGKNVRGQVMPQFASVRRIAEDKGIKWETVDVHLVGLIRRGLIQVRGQYNSAGVWRIMSITVAPPGERYSGAYSTYWKDRHVGHAPVVEPECECCMEEQAEREEARERAELERAHQDHGDQPDCPLCDEARDEARERAEHEARRRERMVERHEDGRHQERRYEDCPRCQEVGVAA
jgi:hypothetical protein